MKIKEFIKEKRRIANLTQPDLAEKAGVGLRFIREMEQGKETLRMDKVNLVLKLFGYELGPIEMKRDFVLIAEPGELKLKGVKTPLSHRKNEQ